MSDKKHVIVGLFVLVGFVLLGTMIVWFEGMAVIIRGGYTVSGHLPSAVGVRGGKRVHQDGIEIGEVREIVSSQPEEPGVWVHMRISPKVRIPREAQFVAQQSTIGDLYLNFETTGKSLGDLPTDGTARLQGDIRAPSLLPEDVLKEVREGLASLKQIGPLVANLTELTAPRTLKDVEAGKPRNLWTTLEQFETTAQSMQNQLDKPDSELGKLLATARMAAEDLRKTLAKASETLDTANKGFASMGEAGKNANALLDKSNALADKLAKDADQVKVLLDNMNGLLTDLRAGKGTLGKLLTDDELHRAMVTLIENLQTLSDNTNRLMTMWRKEGLFAKEGK